MTATRTITLTGRPPVTIHEDQWPVVASAYAKEWDNTYEFQANRTWKWTVCVRRHKDGRAIVYATYSYSSQYQGESDGAAKRGVLLPAGTDARGICDAIQDVCEQMIDAESVSDREKQWHDLAAECIADMPAEAL